MDFLTAETVHSGIPWTETSTKGAVVDCSIEVINWEAMREGRRPLSVILSIEVWVEIMGMSGRVYVAM